MTYLKAFGQFWYDFVIGDDYKIAVAVLLSMVALVAMLEVGMPDEILAVIGGVAIMAAFCVSMYVDTSTSA